MPTNQVDIVPVLGSGPIIEPVSVAETAEYLTLDEDFAAVQDGTLQKAIKAARGTIENTIQKILIARDFEQTMDAPTPVVTLYRRPFLSLVSVAYIYNIESNTWIPLTNSNFAIRGTSYAQMIPKNRSWPQTSGFGGFRVVFRAGMGDPGVATTDDDPLVIAARAAVPSEIREAIMQYAGKLFTHRKGDGEEPQYQAQATGVYMQLPRTVQNLIDGHMDWGL